MRERAGSEAADGLNRCDMMRRRSEIAMSEIIFQIEEAPEGGYTAQALGHAIFTEAESLDELRENVRDAVRCHFDEGVGPKLIRLHFVRDEVLAA
jgi:hypothetical protein